MSRWLGACLQSKKFKKKSNDIDVRKTHKLIFSNRYFFPFLVFSFYLQIFVSDLLFFLTFSPLLFLLSICSQFSDEHTAQDMDIEKKIDLFILRLTGKIIRCRRPRPSQSRHILATSRQTLGILCFVGTEEQIHF